MSRRRRHHTKQQVKLNLAAMLDMAFQLLAFFILTFRPSPMEGQLALRMPPPVAHTNVRPENQSQQSEGPGVMVADNVLILSVYATPSGQVDSVTLFSDVVF